MNLYEIRIQAASNEELVDNLKLLLARLESIKREGNGPLSQFRTIDSLKAEFFMNFCSLKRVL